MSPGRLAAPLVVVASLACMAGMTVPVQAQALTEDWVVVIDVVGQQAPAPYDPVIPPDPRADIETVAVKDLGDRFAVRFATRAGPDGTGRHATVESHLEFILRDPHLGWSQVDVDASGGAFAVRMGEPSEGVAVDMAKAGIAVGPGSKAWSYEVTFPRELFFDGGHYMAGAALGDFRASVRAYGGDAMAAWEESDEADQGGLPDVKLALGGAWSISEFPSRTQEPWYPYYLLDTVAALDVAVDAQERILVAYQIAYQSSSLPKKPHGVYLAEVEEGSASATLLGLTTPWKTEAGSFNDTRVGLALVEGQPHVLYHADPGAGSGLEGAITHAWRAQGAWHVEDALEGLGLGPIYTDHRSGLDVAAGGGRLVAVVRPVSGGAALIEWVAGHWTVLQPFADAAFVHVAVAPDGVVHAGVYKRGTTSPYSSDEIYYDGTLEHADSATGWNRTLVAADLEDANGWARDVHDTGPFDLAVRPDGTPCFFVWSDSFPDVDSEGPSAGLLCGRDGRQLVEAIDFLNRPQTGPGAIDMVYASDGTLLMEYFGHDALAASRTDDGTWWWEVADTSGSAVAVLDDGRAVRATRLIQGVSDLAVLVQHPDAHDDVTRAFFTGPADESYKAAMGYREPMASETEADPAAVPSQPVPPAPSPAQEEDGEDSPASSGNSVPGPGTLVVGLLVSALAMWRRASLRRA